MAANSLPAGLDALSTLGEDIADGLAALGAALGMVHSTEAIVRGKLTALLTTQAEFLTAKAAKLGLTTAQTVADSNGRAFISTARNVLATFLGGEWTQAWEPTGFPNQSTAVPSTIAERQALLGMLKLYFTANAAQEVAGLNVTAARANTLFNALSDTRSAVNAGLTLIGQKKALRDVADVDLRKSLRGTIDELGLLLAPDDPRWLNFGLNLPASAETPDVPDQPVLTPGAAGMVLVDWPDAPRAVRYRVWKQILGVDPDFTVLVTVTESETTLTGQPSGATLKVRVTAINSAGAESLPGDFAQIAVP